MKAFSKKERAKTPKANGRLLLRPRIVLPRADDSTAAVRSIAEETVSPETARWLVSGPMQEVVTRGTGGVAGVGAALGETPVAGSWATFRVPR